MRMKSSFTPIVLSLSLAFAAGCAGGDGSTRETPASDSSPVAASSPSAERTQDVTFHGVTISVPADWTPAPGYETRYQGEDGFAQLELSQHAGSSAEAACRDQAGHARRPYGSTPVIETLTVAGQPACLVLPSQDQESGMRNEAVMIVRLPRPQTLKGETYGFAVLYAGAARIRQIAETLRLPG